MVDHSNLRLLIDAAEEVLAPSPEPDVDGPIPFAAPDPLPAPPIVFSSEMPDWYYFGKGLRASFRDACRLAFRAGLQEIPNRESLRLVDEGIRLHRLLGDAMPTVDRSREDNIHELSVLEAQCNEYKEAVLMATSAYDIVLDLDRPSRSVTASPTLMARSMMIGLWSQSLRLDPPELGPTLAKLETMPPPVLNQRSPMALPSKKTPSPITRSDANLASRFWISLF